MDAEGLEELFAPVGRVRVKRMFGGFAVYLDGVIVALQVDGDLLLKADAETAPAFAAAGSAQWIYTSRSGRPAAMPYWRMPEVCFDDESALRSWTRLALEASRRVEAAKASKAKPAGKRKPASPR